MMNEEIRDREVRVIDQNGEQLGVMPTRKALELAEEAGLDLVKIVPCEKQISYEGIMVPHDDAEGAKRGMCEAIKLHAGSCTIEHLGDLGRLLTDKEQTFLQGCDVLMIPCGGYFTIDAQQARKVIEQIKPKLTILMHFRRGNTGYPVTADVDAVKAVFTEAEDREKSTITFDEDHVPEGVLILKPQQ